MFSPCFVVLYFVSFLVLQSSCWGRESRLLYFSGLLGVMWLLSFTVMWVGLQCVIVTFPGHTHLLCAE